MIYDINFINQQEFIIEELKIYEIFYFKDFKKRSFFESGQSVIVYII